MWEWEWGMWNGERESLKWESLKAGIFKMGNLLRGESLKRGIFKSGNL